MKLKNLIADIDTLKIVGSLDVEVAGIHCDSQRIHKKDIFVAVRGEKVDGHQFIREAVASGASVVVCEEMIGVFPSITQVQVTNCRAALARLAAKFYGRPSEKMRLIGITCTNGKTTTSYLVAAILEAGGIPTGIIGTLAYRFGNRELPAPNTTPPADELQEILAQMLHAGMKAVAMEVSSHALLQHRADEVLWDVGIFTNFTRDHLDYHKTMESYFDAKKILFQQLGTDSKKATAVLNLDDPKSEELRHQLGQNVRVITYGLHHSADVRAESVEQSITGCRFILAVQDQRVQCSTSLCGAYNISNVLAAAATALALGLNLVTIQKGIGSLRSVPGRLERVGDQDSAKTFVVIVDYAHTDDALRNVLNTLRPFVRGRLITVFGCGGNRDASKRSLMGQVASELSDINILTTDNPRYEEPSDIVEQIVAGFKARKNYEAVLDRREAIHKALIMARDGDIVLLAGKGHETYQDIRGRRTPFDDRKVALELLQSLPGIAHQEGGAAWKN